MDDETSNRGRALSKARAESRTLAEASEVESESSAKLAEETRRQLEELQVATIFSLVEEVRVGDLSAKLLFLTNKQAKALDITPLDKFMLAMDIRPRPKFVINFIHMLDSFFPTFRSTMPWSANPSDNEAKGFDPLYSEVGGVEGMRQADRRLVAFLRDCIMPVAIETNALVLLVDPCCAASRHFGIMCEDEARARGGVLPFTVVFCWHTFAYLNQSKNPGSIMHQLMHGPNGSARMKASLQAMEKGWCKAPWAQDGMWDSGRFPSTWMNGPPRGCTHYIMNDGVNSEGDLDGEVIGALRESLLQQFAHELPSISIGMKNSDAFGAPVASLVRRGLPVLLIDSRAHSFSTPRPPTVAEAKKQFTELQGKLEEENSADYYYSCRLAALHAALWRQLRKQGGDSSAKQGLIHEMLQRLREEREGNFEEADVEKGAMDSAQGGQLAQFSPDEQRTLIDEAMEAHLELMRAGAATFFQKVHPARELRNLDAVLRVVEESSSLEALDAALVEASMTWIGFDHRQERIEQLANEQPGLFEERQCDDWGIVCGLRRGSTAPLDVVEEAKRVLLSKLEEWRLEVETWKGDWKAILEEGKLKKPAGHGWFHRACEAYNYDTMAKLFASPLVYSGALHDLTGLAHTINRVARIDRLPTANSFEAMLTLQRAWEKVDVYMHVATRCKWLAKVLFVLVLAVTLTVSIVTAVSLNERTVLPQHQLESVVMVCTLALTALTTATAFTNPTTKWHQLRSAALALESEIWKFRTRSGSYAIAASFGAASLAAEPEDMLRQMTEELSRNVIKSATVADTSFLARFDGLFDEPRNCAVYRHGQHLGGASDGTKGRRAVGDDHHSPLTPAQYLVLRVKPQLGFYQSRLPHYARLRLLFEVSLLCTTLTSAMMAFLHLASWAVIAAASAAAITSYRTQVDVDQKLKRFSDTIAGIDEVLLWWRSLRDVDQAQVANVTLLVKSCEELFDSERQAWVSAAMASAALNKAETTEQDEGHAERGRGGGRQPSAGARSRVAPS